MNQQPSQFFSSPQGNVQFAYSNQYQPSTHGTYTYGFLQAAAPLPLPQQQSLAQQQQQQQQQQHAAYFRQFPRTQLQTPAQRIITEANPLLSAIGQSTSLSTPTPTTRVNLFPSLGESAGRGPGVPAPEVNDPSEHRDDNDAGDGRQRSGRRNATENANEDDENAADDDENGAPVFHIPPPPEDTYPSEAELEQSIHAWSLEHGYELVKRASKKNGQGNTYKRYYHCSKHGARSRSKLTPATRQRANRSSNRIGCPMSIATVAVDPASPEGPWQIRHRKSHHNHGPLDGLKLAGHRRRARMGGVEKAVDGLFAIGSTAAQVLQFLHKTHPNGLFTRTDVGNMKIKWKKYGSCADHPTRAANVRLPGDQNIACANCRQKHQGCGKERPVCHNCAESRAKCVYEGGTVLRCEENPTSADADAANDHGELDATIAGMTNEGSTPIAPASQPHVLSSREQMSRTQEILNNLQSFQQEHIMPRKLNLLSSAVEVLAQSTCGTGNSYRNTPMLQQEQDWPAFRDSVTEAARRENHFDVLTGAKLPPVRPNEPSSTPPTTGTPKYAAEVELWNEYIKQLAIYDRRNNFLLAELSAKLAPNFRSRVQTLTAAHDVWTTLEEMCLPRGSQQAYALYNTLIATTLATSRDLNDYVGRLERTYAQFKVLRLNGSSPVSSSTVTYSNNANSKDPPRTGEDIFPDESLCLLFLRNLGPPWKRWADGLLATNNIAGFGTGQRVGFRDVSRRVLAYHAMQRQNVIGGANERSGSA